MNKKVTFLVLAVAALVAVTDIVVQQGLKADVISTTNKRGSEVWVLANDETNLPLTQPTITVTSEATKEAVSLTSQNNTGYYVASVTPGSYTVTVHKVGYTDDSQPLVIRFGETQKLTFNLQPSQ